METLLKYLFSQKELNIWQRRWIELLKDYDCSILYHSDKVNVGVDSLSWKYSGFLHKEDNLICYVIWQELGA